MPPEGPDPNLTPADTCCSVRPGSPNWWESPDIQLNPTGITGVTPPTGVLPGDAQGGVTNKIVVTGQRNGACTVQFGVIYEVWVIEPSLAIIPVNATSIPNTGLTALLWNQGKTQLVVDWNLPATTTNPNLQPGHRCMIVRVYPAGISPDPALFHRQMPPGDPGDVHVAQRNITIIPVKPGAPPVRLPIKLGNVESVKVQAATIQVVVNNHPNKWQLSPLLPDLKALTGFQQISPSAPRKIGLVFEDFSDAPIRSNITRLISTRRQVETSATSLPPHWQERPELRPFIDQKIMRRFPDGWDDFPDLPMRRGQPTIQARVRLAPKQVSTFDFFADVEDLEPGGARIHYVTQHDEKGNIVGGITVILVNTGR